MVFTATVRPRSVTTEFDLIAERGRNFTVHFEMPAGRDLDGFVASIATPRYYGVISPALEPELSFDDGVATLAWTAEQIDHLGQRRGGRLRYFVHVDDAGNLPGVYPHENHDPNGARQHELTPYLAGRAGTRFTSDLAITGTLTVLPPGELSPQQSPLSVVTATVEQIA